jgi:serine protease
MNKLTTVAALLAITTLTTNAEQSQPDNTAKSLDAKSRYIVLFNNQASAKTASAASVFKGKHFSAANARNLISTLGGKAIHALSSVSGMAAELTQAQLAVLKTDPQVALIEADPKRIFQAQVSPYGIAQIQADQLNDNSSTNIKICIPDTGIDLAHEDLAAGNITGEVSNTLTIETDLGEWSTDTYGHGTHMAGTIAAVGNDIGTVGVNPGGNIKLHAVKVVSNPGWWPFYGSDLIAAVERCQAAGANIINMSIAGSKSSVAEQQALQAAYDAGILLVGASGKGGSEAHSYPASYDSVISAAAIDNAGAPWIYSHYNDQIELSAPGVEVKSTTPNNNYADWDGTSVATAYLSGAAGLIWGHHPECSNAQIRNIMQQTAKDLAGAGRDDNTGYGLVQVKDAVELIDLRGCNGDGVVNNRPTITGNPASSVDEGVSYLFIPTITDADVGETLTLSISNKPSWTSFDANSGELSGIPADGDFGVYPDISITVTDSKGASASTLLFSIEVVNVDFPVPPEDIEQYLARDGSDIVLLNPDGSIKSQISVNDADSDPANELQTLSKSGSTVTLSHDGGTVSIDDNDADASNEIQSLQGVLAQGNDGGGNEITNIAAPTTVQSVATKGYVDNSIAAVRAEIMQEIPPMIFDVNHSDTSTWVCVEKDVQQHCADEDGCTIRFVMQHEVNDSVRAIDAHFYIENSLSNNHEPGLHGWMVEDAGGINSFILGYSVNHKYDISGPWGWAAINNYKHQNCNNGVQGPAFIGQDKYKLTFIAHPHHKVKFIIYDR